MTDFINYKTTNIFKTLDEFWYANDFFCLRRQFTFEFEISYMNPYPHWVVLKGGRMEDTCLSA